MMVEKERTENKGQNKLGRRRANVPARGRNLNERFPQ